MPSSALRVLVVYGVKDALVYMLVFSRFAKTNDVIFAL
jgi:hypothetical protein